MAAAGPVETLLILPRVYPPKEAYPEVVPRTIHVYHTRRLEKRFVAAIVTHAPHFSFHTYDDDKAEQFLSYYFEPFVVERFRELRGQSTSKEILWCGLLYIHGGKCIDESFALDCDPEAVVFAYEDRPRRERWLCEMLGRLSAHVA